MASGRRRSRRRRRHRRLGFRQARAGSPGAGSRRRHLGESRDSRMHVEVVGVGWGKTERSWWRDEKRNQCPRSFTFFLVGVGVVGSEGESRDDERHKSKQENTMRRSRRSSGSAPPAPLLLLLLVLLLAVTCLLGVTAPLASAQSDDGDDAPSYVNDEDEAQEARSPSSSTPPSTPPSIDDLAPGAVVSTLRGSPRWKFLPDLFVRRTALVDCEGGQVRKECEREKTERETESKTDSSIDGFFSLPQP